MNSRFSGPSNSRPRATPDTVCQKCLKKGHFLFDCKNARPYVSRPSRTAQLENPKLRAKDLGKPSVDLPEEFAKKGTADKILAEKERERERERKKFKTSSSSPSEDDSESESKSDSDSQSGSDSGTDTDSGASASGSSDRSAERDRKRKIPVKRDLSEHDYDRSPRREPSRDEFDDRPRRRGRSESG